ncbi:MAG: protein-glutamate O-methyltransferase CheR [Deltaproteobacteria bacterium]|nr:protein-glutamate O-methyltransferase CheR [Deltaproteobacteria bacterium]
MLTLGLNSKPKLSNDTFRFLRDVIYARSGIAFAETKKYLLETRLMRRLEERNLKTFEDYYYFLTYDPAREAEFRHLLNSVVTNETSFFRDPVQLDVFKGGVIPRLIEAKLASGGKHIRIWSAACSTGEEPYTLAMMLMEEPLICKMGITIEIIGSDLSDVVLKTAQSARYDRYSLRNTPEVYLRKYFVPDGDNFMVNGRVQEVVKYRSINLFETAETRAVRGMDVVFCRNVLIYFDEASKKKVCSHLYDSLVKGGYLLVGFSESLHNITRLFRPVSIERSVVYQKS